MTYGETGVAPGGLMRCCLATIEHYITDHAEEEALDLTLDCEHEPEGNGSIRLVRGVWEWNQG